MTSGETRRRFVVTGGAAGIGLAVATQLVHRGDHVTVVDRAAPPLQSVDHIQCDLSADPSTPLAAVVAEDAPLHGVAHLAGLGRSVPLEQESARAMEHLFRVNVIAGVEVTRMLLPRLRRAAGASVVFTSSVQARSAVPDSVAYAGTKGAVESITHSLALDLVDDDVRVNCVAPGTVKTELWRKIQRSLGRTEQQMHEHGGGRRLGKPVTPEEVAAVVCFLLSNDSEAINAAVVPVDRGLGVALIP